MKKTTLIPGILLCLTACCADADETVTIESLLKEMLDRDSLARFPERDFRLQQHSSYNRASKTPAEPKGWFNNKDFNSGKGEVQETFIRVEEHKGRKEWVLMDHEGAGAIVRTWMPFREVPEEVTIRFYLDGAEEPALEGNPCTLFNGDGLIPHPLAHPSLFSAVSYFPIPYAKSCKVTLSELPFFFQFTFRAYVEGTPVKTFTMKDFDAARALAEESGQALLNPQAKAVQDPLAFSATLAARQEESLELPAGNGAVRKLTVKLGDYSDPSVTRSVVLKMEFDGKETVWCPVGDFFGSGIGLNPFQGWYRTVDGDGTMTCRWVMPYRQSARISVVNLGGKPVDVHLEAGTGGWSWDDRSMYFHAGWRGQYPVPTRPYSDWNYVTLKGRGVYVGDTLTVMNPVERWWGEGDEKIWVDGEDFPSIFGTGTEDYYAYSWGGVSTDFYEHPFQAQPRCHKYNKLNRKTNSGERNTQGYSTETRTRALDTMPFGSSLQLDMEVWSWSDCDMGYGVGAYWYGDAATTSNREPDPDGALAIPPLPDMRAPAAAKASAFKDASECESMKVLSRPDGVTAKPQALESYPGHWSAAAHLFVKGAKVGDDMELGVPAMGAARAKLVLHATKSHDYGILRFSVNGMPAGADVDLYAAKPIPSGAIDLGEFAPVDGVFRLQVRVVGKNPKSTGTFFGLDCVTWSPPPVGPQTGGAGELPNVVVNELNDRLQLCKAER